MDFFRSRLIRCLYYIHLLARCTAHVLLFFYSGIHLGNLYLHIIDQLMYFMYFHVIQLVHSTMTSDPSKALSIRLKLATSTLT
jgi:phosphate starvation-inducible membrane PsiE